MKITAVVFLLGLCAYSRGFLTPVPQVSEAPARVYMGNFRSPKEEELFIEVEAFDESHSFRLVPVTSPMGKDLRLQRMVLGKDGFLVIQDLEDVPDSEPLGMYHDPTKGAFLKVMGNTVEGILTPTVSLKTNGDGTYVATRLHPSHLPVSGNWTTDCVDIPKITPQNRFTSDHDMRDIAEMSPEIYVIVDNTISAILGDNKRVKEYISIFWNAVNQRFATMTDPKTELKLVGAMIIDDTAKEPFIRDNIIKQNLIKGQTTLFSISDWLYEHRSQLPKYDLAYLMTGMNMVNMVGHLIQESITGYSYTGAACLVSSIHRRSFNTAIGEDLGASYMGVMTAAHEVAHNLGAPHDGDAEAENCPWNDGYIMSYVPNVSNKLFFSPCSQKLMKAYLKTSRAKCLKEITEGKEAIELSQILPGELLGMDEQCQKITGESESYVSTSVEEDSLCAVLVCQWQVQKGSQTFAYTMSTGQPAAEGSSCRSGGKCSNGACSELSIRELINYD